MKSYAYIETLFKAILDQSKAIQGRFFLLPKGGQEINTDEFDQVLKEATGLPKFPAAVLVPPKSTGTFAGSDGWEQFDLHIFFLNTTFYSGVNQVTAPNLSTGTSTKKITQEWDDMKTAAQDFVRVLDEVQRGKSSSLKALTGTFRMPAQNKSIEPVTFLGNKKLSGVRMNFTASVYVGCDVSDYENEIVLNLQE